MGLGNIEEQHFGEGTVQLQIFVPLRIDFSEPSFLTKKMRVVILIISPPVVLDLTIDESPFCMSPK